MANSDARTKNKIIQAAGMALSKRATGVTSGVPTGYSGFEDAEEALGPVATNRAGARAGVAMSRGIVASARLIFTGNPTDNDTIGIGGKTFIFVAALGAATANVQVLIAGSAAATLASLVKAVNGTAAPAEWVEATTPFAVTVVADAVSTSLRVRYAASRGGAATAALSGSIALAEAITAAADIWNCTNLNVSGKSEFSQAMVTYCLTLTAAMLTAAGFNVELPFTPSQLFWSVKDSTGAPKSGTVTTDTLTFSGSTVTFAQAGATHLIAGDVVCFTAVE